MQSRPRIAVLAVNTLTALGLESLISRMMPQAEISLFPSTDALSPAEADEFVHYFVSAEVLMADIAFYRKYRRRTVVLTAGATAVIPADFHVIDATQDEKDLVRSILRLSSGGHRPGTAAPHSGTMLDNEPALTRREAEVLRHIVLGRINKEIADSLSVSPTTVISHRKHLTEKLGTKSVSAFTVYAVMHGIVSLEEL